MRRITEKFSTRTEKCITKNIADRTVSICAGAVDFVISDYRMMLVPVISAGCSRPMIFSMVGAMSASTPPSRSVHG